MNQVRGFRAHYDKFQAVDTEIIEISCDSVAVQKAWVESMGCLLYTSPSPRDLSTSRMPSSA